MRRTTPKRTKSTTAQSATPSDCSALYLRVSTDKQADEGFSLDAQRGKLESYCTAMGWEVCAEHIYIDAGESGSTTARTAYQRMVSAIDAGIVRRVVAVKLDRLSRNTRDFLDLLDYCDARGVGVVSIAESFDTSTPVGRAVVTVLMAFSELERRQIKERVMSGKAEKARQGGFNGGNIPYGYTYNAGVFMPNDRAAIVQRIFAQFVAGEGLTGIVRQLDTDAVPTARGGKWSTAAVRYILTNGAYAGLAQWDGVESAEGMYPAIIEAATYEVAQRRMAALRPGNPNFGREAARSL